jgi:hypothetical protein
MTDDRQWELHQPVTARRPVEPGAGLADWQVVGCHGPDPDRRSTCAWRSTPESFSTAGYAAHLQELGAPDHIVHYWRFWAELVEMPWGGRIHRDALARELADYTTVMTEASAVYCELADLSKPNTAARHVIAGAEQRFAGRVRRLPVRRRGLPPAGRRGGRRRGDDRRRRGLAAGLLGGLPAGPGAGHGRSEGARRKTTGKRDSPLTLWHYQ